MATPETIRYRDGSSKIVDLTNETTGDSLTVYFRTNSDTMFSNDIADLAAFKRQHANADAWIVEGYADDRGSLEDNVALGQKRADGVAHYLNRSGITTVSHGEASADGMTKEEMKRDRRVTLRPQYFKRAEPVTVKGQIISQALAELPPPYLVDLSGSMADEVGIIRTHKFDDGAVVYAFNDCTGVEEIDPTQASTCGGTPLYASIEEVLRKGVSELTVISDGEETNGGSLSSVISLAQRNGTKINVVGAGVYSAGTKADLMSLATETGGSFYIRDN
ncbi:hypothetical protein CL619_01855 [archaeon]|nr:hypothetical protein [archaeon]